MFSCFAKSYKEGGLKVFYKGIGVAMYRAALVNAGAFWSFEGALRLLGREEQKADVIYHLNLFIKNMKSLSFAEK